ncbi:LysR family transcriptional regulator [Streptomyces sp. NPDC048442]|uniref:LysR family transcriptional regulator n=1 Tax=Streptomyces sp. NPDC048442 TaxID=3154823 RepID=UPI0034375015
MTHTMEDMNLSRRLLEQFLTVAQEKHFGRAAERLGMSQPPLSQSIQRLERTVGVRLLDRGPGGVRLTAAGKVFATDAQRLLDLQIAAVTRARRVASGKEGGVRVGYVSLLSHLYLPTMLREAAEQLPGLRVHLHHSSSAGVADQVRDGMLDLGFLRDPGRLSDELVSRLIVTERIGAAVPRGHRLAEARSIDLVQLADEDFVLPHPTALPVLAEQLQLACREAGFTPHEVATADDLSGLFSYVSAGLCVSLAPESLRHLADSGVILIPLQGRTNHLDTAVYAIHRPDADAAVIRLLEMTTNLQPQGL